MKYNVALLFGGAASVANAAYCNDAFTDKIGNFFCPGAVKQIKYAGLDIPGTYRAVSAMDNSGRCEFTDKPYSGSIAPFDEGLQLSFRGPLKLDNVAVYYPTGKKRAAPKVSHSKRHGHQHLHKKHKEEKRADMVYATIDGQVQSWENDWFGPSTAKAEPAAPTAPAAPVAPAESPKEDSNPLQIPSSPSASDSDIPLGDFTRAAYYSAKDQVADGLVFLANKGDNVNSGVWDTVWGGSLAYCNEDGTAAAASPVVLGDVLLDDSTEINIYSDAPCNDDCGTVRPGAVAYKGFEGQTKVFVARLQMPLSGKTGAGIDMPAMWFLNAAIPRTGQYSECSCWKGDNPSPIQGGCGEFDVIEVLSPGDTKAKSTFHFAGGLGDSHFFDRPVDAPINVAIVFDAPSSTTSIKIISDDFDFGTSLTEDQVQAMIQDELDVKLLSLAALG